MFILKLFYKNIDKKEVCVTLLAIYRFHLIRLERNDDLGLILLQIYDGQL